MKLKLTEHSVSVTLNPHPLPPMKVQHCAATTPNKQIDEKGQWGPTVVGGKGDVKVMATGAGGGMALSSGGALEQGDYNEAPMAASVIMKDARCTGLEAKHG